MSNYSILVDSVTQDYVEIDGNIANALSTETMMYIRLATPRLGWMYSAGDFTYGSNMYRYTSTRSAATPQLIEKDIFITLEPMVALRQITNLMVQFTGYSATRAWLFKISAQDILGNAIQFTYPYYMVAQ